MAVIYIQEPHMVTCLRAIIIGILRHSTEPANTHSMTDTAIPHIGPTVYLLGQASFQRRRMQRLDGDFQVIDKIMRITFPDLDIEAGLAMLIAANEVVPRETADIALSTAEKIVGGYCIRSDDRYNDCKRWKTFLCHKEFDSRFAVPVYLVHNHRP